MKIPKRAPKLCARLAAGETLDAICAERDMPSVQTVHRWLRDHAGFRQEYAQARKLQADRMADQVVEIADALGAQADEEAARSGRLRIDARKWAVGRLAEVPVPTVESPPVRRRLVFVSPDQSDPSLTGDAR